MTLKILNKLIVAYDMLQDIKGRDNVGVIVKMALELQGVISILEHELEKAEPKEVLTKGDK